MRPWQDLLQSVAAKTTVYHAFQVMVKPGLAAKHSRCDPGQSFGYSDLSTSIVGMVSSCARSPILCLRTS